MKPVVVACLAVVVMVAGARAQAVRSNRFAAPIGWFAFEPEGHAQSMPDKLDFSDGSRNGFDDLADEIIVIGERQRRDFQLVKPGEELTGPRALDAAQPVVPGIGASCSYKTLCYDMSQPPLRADLAKLFGE